MCGAYLYKGTSQANKAALHVLQQCTAAKSEHIVVSMAQQIVRLQTLRHTST